MNLNKTNNDDNMFVSIDNNRSFFLERLELDERNRMASTTTKGKRQNQSAGSEVSLTKRVKFVSYPRTTLPKSYPCT